MKFGKVDHPQSIDFSLPADPAETRKILLKTDAAGLPSVLVGCAKWDRKELKNFYPKGNKDALKYYGTQFNAIEMNATFYHNFTPDQVKNWYDKTPAHFRFFPKIQKEVSHTKWLNEFEQPAEEFLTSVMHLKEKLGTVFLQMRDNFSPKFFDRLQNFVEWWPKDVHLAIELRHPEWFADPAVSKEKEHLFEENNIANILVDTAGRRDMLHMRLTNNEAFVRFVGANHETDYSRLNDWADRLKQWSDEGLQNIHFFVHQNVEGESPKLAAHFISELNERIGVNIKIPQTNKSGQTKLF